MGMTPTIQMTMSKKTNNYISEELDFLERKAKEIKKYVDDNPYHLVEDRTITRRGKDGSSYEEIVQKIESIHKSLRDALKDYSNLIEAIDKLREKEEAKVEARGKVQVNSQMKRLLTK